MTRREPGGGNLTGESLFDAEKSEWERGGEINGDPRGSYTKGKVKLFPSVTVTVFIRLPLPLSVFSSSLTSTFSHQPVFSFSPLKTLLLFLNFHLSIFFNFSLKCSKYVIILSTRCDSSDKRCQYIVLQRYLMKLAC